MKKYKKVWTYVFLFLIITTIISTYTYATATVNSHNQTLNNFDSTVITYKIGMIIYMKDTQLIINATKNLNSTATTWYLYNSNGTTCSGSLINTGSIINNVLTNINTLATEGNYYCLLIDNSGGGYVFGNYSSTSSYPYSNTDLNWTGRYVNGIVDTTNVVALTSITTEFNSIITTVRKESDGSIIYQNTTIILESDGGIVTNNYINGTGIIPITIPDNYTISAGLTGYNTRYLRANINNDSSEILTFYLNNGTSVLFNFQTPTGSVIPGVELSIYRLVNGTTVLVEERISDVSGIAQVSLETTGVYTFTTYIEGYNNYSFSLNPVIFTSYDVILTPTTSGNDIEPSATVQFNPTNYYRFQNVNFQIQFLSQYNSLTNYYYNITYPGGSNTGTGTNTRGEQFTNNFNLASATPGSIITIYYNYTLDNNNIYSGTYNYSIVYINSNRTWVTLGNNINTTTNQDSITGYYIGERIIIVTFISIILFGVGWSIGGGIVGLILALIPIILFTQSGFVPKQLYYVTILFIIFYIIGRGSDS